MRKRRPMGVFFRVRTPARSYLIRFFSYFYLLICKKKCKFAADLNLEYYAKKYFDYDPLCTHGDSEYSTECESD